MMKEFTTPTGRQVAIVTVPKEAISHVIVESVNNLGSCLFSHRSQSIRDTEAVELPEGKWSILGRPTELTEEQCADFVNVEYDAANYWYGIARESFLSWLTSIGVTDTDNVLILVKEKYVDAIWNSSRRSFM